MNASVSGNSDQQVSTVIFFVFSCIILQMNELIEEINLQKQRNPVGQEISQVYDNGIVVLNCFPIRLILT